MWGTEGAENRKENRTPHSEGKPHSGRKADALDAEKGKTLAKGTYGGMGKILRL